MGFFVLGLFSQCLAVAVNRKPKMSDMDSFIKDFEEAGRYFKEESKKLPSLHESRNAMTKAYAIELSNLAAEALGQMQAVGAVGGSGGNGPVNPETGRAVQ